MKYFCIGWASSLVLPFLVAMVQIFKSAFSVSFDQVRVD